MRILKFPDLIVCINDNLIALGVVGVLISPVSALFHNVSTLAISLNGMSNLLVE